MGGLLLGIFVLLIFGAKVSGSHYNPAITLAFMLRRDTGKFSRPLGIAYIVFQVAGGFVGGLLAYFFTQTGSTFGVDAGEIGQAITSEIIGTFFVAFLYLTQTENKTKMSSDPAITTLIIASAYLSAMLLVSGPDNYLTALNPAIALGTMFQEAYHGKSDGFARIYIYIPFPLIGGVVAVAFHEFVYKRVTETI
jgi:glycerol uptake facilitator-like aquaporin